MLLILPVEIFFDNRADKSLTRDLRLIGFSGSAFEPLCGELLLEPLKSDERAKRLLRMSRFIKHSLDESLCFRADGVAPSKKVLC